MLEKLKAFWNSMSLKAKLELLVATVVVFAVTYRNILMDLIAASAKRLMTQTQAKSDQLTKEENADNAAANTLVQQAADLPKTETTVTDDWNKAK